MTQEQTIEAAVTRCHQAWTKAVEHFAKTQRHTPADILDLDRFHREYAGQAYRNALPYLTSSVQIDAFIACIAHGMALGAIDEKTGAKLLYAAQVAITSRKAQSRIPLPGSTRAETNSANTPGPANPPDSLNDTPTPLPLESATPLKSTPANPPQPATSARPPKPAYPQQPPADGPLMARAAELLRQALQEQKSA